MLFDPEEILNRFEADEQAQIRLLASKLEDPQDSEDANLRIALCYLVKVGLDYESQKAKRRV